MGDLRAEHKAMGRLTHLAEQGPENRKEGVDFTELLECKNPPCFLKGPGEKQWLGWEDQE